MIDVAATGSVGPSAAPSTKAISHGQAGHEVGGDGHGDRGGQHQAHGQQDHRAGHEPDVLGGEAERRRVEDHRQEDQEDQLGRDLDVGREGNEPDDQPAEHQRHRVRHAALLRRHGQEHHRREQQDEEVDLTHRTPVLVGPVRTSVRPPSVPRRRQSIGRACEPSCWPWWWRRSSRSPPAPPPTSLPSSTGPPGCRRRPGTYQPSAEDDCTLGPAAVRRQGHPGDVPALRPRRRAAATTRDVRAHLPAHHRGVPARQPDPGLLHRPQLREPRGRGVRPATTSTPTTTGRPTAAAWCPGRGGSRSTPPPRSRSRRGQPAARHERPHQPRPAVRARGHRPGEARRLEPQARPRQGQPVPEPRHARPSTPSWRAGSTRPSTTATCPATSTTWRASRPSPPCARTPGATPRRW